MEHFICLIPLFFLTALLYSSVGFAGGSTYLALLALFAFPYAAMPKVALLCNLIVAAGGFYVFFREGFLSPKKVFPFVVTSIPAAYAGGSIPISKTAFLWMLSLSLLFAGLRLFFSEKAFAAQKEVSWAQTWKVGLPLGAMLGFFSGLVGIGGGIFLAPLLYFLGWAHAKEVATASSFFILVNSLSGLLGQISKSTWTLDGALVLPLAAAVFLGGQIGSRLGAGTFPKLLLQRGTAALILFISGRLLWGLL
jgi:hypothetical protein